MKKIVTILTYLIFSTLNIYSAKSISEVINNLRGIKSYSTQINFAASQPQQNGDIVYNATLKWQINPSDSIEGYEFVNEYTPGGGNIFSFESYFNGNFFRFDNGKFREYHWSHDSIPFIGRSAVQKVGLFNSLLPYSLASFIDQELKSSNSKVRFHSDTTINGQMVDYVVIKTYYNNELVRDINIEFNPTNSLPIKYNRTNNIDQITEQTLNVEYTNSSTEPLPPLSEEYLKQKYSDIFSKYRISNYGVKEMVGKMVPDFTLPTINDSRFVWSARDKNPTLIVFLDITNEMSRKVIPEIRDAINESPYTIDILWIYNSNRIDDIQQIISPQRNEQVLIGGGRLATDLGITGFPTILFVDTEGKIINTQIGYNNELKEIVIQKVTLDF